MGSTSHLLIIFSLLLIHTAQLSNAQLGSLIFPPYSSFGFPGPIFPGLDAMPSLPWSRPFTSPQETYNYAGLPLSPARQCRQSGVCPEIGSGTTIATTWRPETTTWPTTKTTESALSDQSPTTTRSPLIATTMKPVITTRKPLFRLTMLVWFHVLLKSSYPNRGAVSVYFILIYYYIFHSCTNLFFISIYKFSLVELPCCPFHFVLGRRSRSIDK